MTERIDENDFQTRSETSSVLGKDFTEFDSTSAYDLVIVGSGYGAAVAAATFAGATHEDGRKIRVCILERGREYLPGAFPSTMSELPGHVRVSVNGGKPMGKRDALFDVRIAGDVNALMGNGLGGGSLINGGVMIEPQFDSFSDPFPHGVVADLGNGNYFERARTLLGAKVKAKDSNEWTENVIDRHSAVAGREALSKTKAMTELAQNGVIGISPLTTIRMRQEDNAEQPVALEPCALCGDCMIGCNVGAKASLDTNLLAFAKSHGVEIFTSASVLYVHRDNQDWLLETVHTDPMVQARRGKPVSIRAHRVLLAAGSMGSTEILLRSRSKGLHLSPRLGHRFSINGDNIAAIRFDGPVDTSAAETTPLIDKTTAPRRIGPEITYSLSWPATPNSRGFLVQEFAIPAPLRWLFNEVANTRSLLDQMKSFDKEIHQKWKQPGLDPLAIDPTASNRLVMIGIIGHDSSTGRIAIPRGSLDEGCAVIRWPQVGQDPAMKDAYARLASHLEWRFNATDRLIANPLWRLTPDALDDTTEQSGGGVLTVHPLGGCAMGESEKTGVVDAWGVVFQTANTSTNPRDTWQGTLRVLDGSIIPGSLGVNPALTISAISLRNSEHWLKESNWKPSENDSPPYPRRRIQIRSPQECVPAQPYKQTKLQVLERLSGPVQLNTPTGPEEFMAELTVGFEPASIEEFTSNRIKTLNVSQLLKDEFPSANSLLLYKLDDWKTNGWHQLPEIEKAKHAVIAAELTGELRLLQREPNHPLWRIVRAGGAYLRNRGGRDLADEWNDKTTTKGFIQKIIKRVVEGTQLASQSGEVRRMEYILAAQKVHTQGNQEKNISFWKSHLEAAPIHGLKRLTYACKSNPWTQLTQLELTQLGTSLLSSSSNSPILSLDGRFAAGSGIPLLRIVEQDNQVDAIRDLTRFGFYWARLLLKLHIWSIRQPDPPSKWIPQRLPGAVPGLPPPEIIKLNLEPSQPPSFGGHEIVVRLTRYKGKASNCDKTPPPLAFIHGYSASGTTFAHESLEPGAAKFFWEKGRDIWIIDLRTSAGLPTSQHPWAFEDAAWADIPVAIDHIAGIVAKERGQEKGKTQLDIFAHCIGGVMLSMALLTDSGRLRSEAPPQSKPTRHIKELESMHPNIRKVILSQKGFIVHYTNANIFRGYLTHFTRELFRGKFSFRPKPTPSTLDKVLDGFLSTFPYPKHEWQRAHPWFGEVSWEATRRRMDALYGRDFNLENVTDAFLDRIDDFFGPLNLETVAQAIHFARLGTITTRDGRNPFVSLSRISAQWPQDGTLLINAIDSGMVDPSTGDRMKAILDEAFGTTSVNSKIELIHTDGGHQDCLVGKPSRKLFEEVECFLNHD